MPIGHYPVSTMVGKGLPGTFGVECDFIGFVSGTDNLLIAAVNTGTVTDGGVVGGEAVINPGAGTTDNDELYIHTWASYLVSATKPMYFGARLSADEANVDDVNILAGFISQATVENLLVDNGGGTPSNYCGATFCKVDGGTVWNTEVSVTTTQTAGSTTAFTDDTMTLLEIYVTPRAGTCIVHFYKNGNVIDANGLELTVAGQVACRAVVGWKNGGSNAEEGHIDWMCAVQTR